MHEHSFIEAILKDVEDLDRVEGLVIEVGELAGIEADHLREHMKEGRNFEVEVSTKESKVKCECGFDGRARVLERLHDFVVFDCPQCGGTPSVLEGDEIKIKKVVYSD